MRMTLETFPRRSWANLVTSASVFALVLTVYVRNQNDQKQGAILVRHVDDKTTSFGLTGDASAQGASVPHSVAASAVLHPQCYRKNPTGHANRPILIFKYSRTGSTWFAYTGALLELKSKKPPLFNWEMDTCNIAGFDSGGFVKYAQEYFGRHQNGTYIKMENYHDPNPKRNPDRLPSFMKFRCLQTVNPDVRDEGGPLIATLQPHETRVKSPPLSDDHWRQIFEAVPNLAVGVLVRTNSVKRAISFIASETQREQCGTKKLDGSEKCIKNLPKKIQLDIAQLRKSIGDSELKRVVIPNFAARLSSKYGDGKMFCLTYEGLERNIAGEMKAMGKFIGAEVDEASLKRIRKESRSYKRGSNDLAEYIANYDEVRESLSSNKCLLEQLETPLEVSSEAKTLFPSCNFYNASLVPKILQGMI